MKDAKYVDLPIGAKFRPHVRGPLLTKESKALTFSREGKIYRFFPHTLVLVN